LLDSYCVMEASFVALEVPLKVEKNELAGLWTKGRKVVIGHDNEGGGSAVMVVDEL